ncbi:3896_t:CDS:2, partial [Scutellospora calospora]
MKLLYIILCIVLLSSTVVWAYPAAQENLPAKSSDDKKSDEKPIEKSDDKKSGEKSDDKKSDEKSVEKSDDKKSGEKSDDKKSGEKSDDKKSNEKPVETTASSSQGKNKEQHSGIKITSPKKDQCFQTDSELKITWTSSLSEKVRVKVLYYNNPIFKTENEPNIVDASAGGIAIKTTGWPAGSYVAVIAL